MGGATLIEQGLNLMLYGMGTVFVFLTVLVITTVSMSTIIKRWLPDEEIPVPSSVKSHADVDDHIVSIIQAALAKHRCRWQK
ncbi:MAG: OadG family protein [Arenicellales bacterium]